ncbi:transposase, partial [Scytonema sp. UIC 10036]|uniref:transposase n=1 Tax=Scytonema sp. UIC 10036 TaxID=2304196 RepID=UPI00140F5DCE
LWNKYGSLQAWGIDKNTIIKSIRNTPELRKLYGSERFNLSSEIWERTVQSVIDDIHAVQEAAKVQVIRQIYSKFKPEKKEVVKGKKILLVESGETSFRDELVKSLNSQEWQQYPLISRWVRQYYKRGHTWVNNQIVINATSGYMKGKGSRKGKVTTYQIPGFMDGKKCQWIKVSILTGRVTPKAGRLRFIINALGKIELHYPKTTKIETNPSTDTVGIDKGFTEGFYGSNGVAYAQGLGTIINNASDSRTQKNKKRQKLFAISRRVDAAKSARILKNNLGRQKANKLERTKRQTITQLIRTATNQIFNEFGEVVAEDLSKHIKGKKRAKAVNRKLNEWSKGELQKALDEISIRKDALVTLVNACYTSQVDHRNGTLLGKRLGDRFFTFDGDVWQADKNAALVIQNRASDFEITRFMKKEQVHKILLERTALFLADNGHSLESAVSMGWLDEKHINQGKPPRRRR